jgi:hypothetical protein
MSSNNSGEGENLIPGVGTLCCLVCLVVTGNYDTWNETRKESQLKIVPEEVQRLDFVDKDFIFLLLFL